MEVANIYDNGPISPICRVKDNVALWMEQKYIPYKVEYIEPIPASSPYTIDLVALAGAATIAANNQVAKQATVVLQTAANELLHLRWFPLDDVEGMLWELDNQSRFSPGGGQARVSLFTDQYDPFLATTTFWIIGTDKKANIGAWNPWPIAQPAARFSFFGYRYILGDKLAENTERLPATTPMTYLPIQGR